MCYTLAMGSRLRVSISFVKTTFQEIDKILPTVVQLCCRSKKKMMSSYTSAKQGGGYVTSSRPREREQGDDGYIHIHGCIHIHESTKAWIYPDAVYVEAITDAVYVWAVMAAACIGTINV